jgi:EmrB/QacA subfamily drug resistance transporter
LHWHAAQANWCRSFTKIALSPARYPTLTDGSNAMTSEAPADDAATPDISSGVRGSAHRTAGGEYGSARSGPQAKLDHAAIRAIVAGIMLAMFLSALEQTIVAPALPAIGKSLGDVDDLSWVITSYLLALTATTPLFGKLSDIYGRRAILLLAVSIFIAGSIACALAPTLWALVLARGLQGIGGGGLLPIAQTIIADLLSPRERPVVQGRTSIMFMSASILGPVLGGLLTDHLHWSFIFWINVPLGGIALVMTERALRRLPRNDRPHQLDIIGAALMLGAAIALMLALSLGGTHYPWASWQMLTLIGGSGALWMLFALRLLTAREPFIPLAILRGRVTSTMTVAAFFSIGTVIGVTIYMPLYCQTVLGVSASLSGLALIAYMGGATLGSLVSTRLVVHMRHYMRVPIGGLIVAVVTLIVLAIDPGRKSFGEVVGLLLILGLGLGPMYPVSTIVMQNAVKPHQLGTATGTLNFFRTLGGAIVVAIFGAIVLGEVAEGLPALTVDKLAAGQGDLALAFHWVFIAAAICLVISFFCLLVVEEQPLHGPLRAAESPAE